MGWLFGRRADDRPLTPEEMLAQARTAAPVTAPPHPDASGGFRLAVEDVFFITGRGLVVTGRVEGVVHVGSRVSLRRDGLDIASSEVTAIENSGTAGVRSAATGEAVGLLLDGLTRNDVQPGDVVSS